MNKLAILGMVCAMSLVFASCKPPTAQHELIIISPHSPEIRAEFTTGFTEWYKLQTGKSITLRWLDVGGTGEAINYIKSRNTGKNPAGGVDVFFGGGDYPFIKMSSLGLLDKHPLPDSIASAIPAIVNGMKIYPGDSTWYGAALSGFGIMTNIEVAKRNNLPVPRHWEDLTDPKYHGWVASADPRYSGSVHVMYEIILQSLGWVKGWQVLERMAANVNNFPKGATNASKDVAIGQAAFGLVIDFYAYAEIARYGAAHISFSLPDSQTFINPDGIAVLKNSGNAVAAHSFVNYVLSHGQNLWIRKAGSPHGPRQFNLCRLPVDTTLYKLDTSLLAVTENPFLLTSPLRYNAGLAGKRWDVVNDLIAARCIAVHDKLRALTSTQVTRLPKINISEEQALLLAATWSARDKAAIRIQTINQWTRKQLNEIDALRREYP